MKDTGYLNYEQYRDETDKTTPESEEQHKSELICKLETLYSQKDYRSLETIVGLAEALAEGEKDNLYWLVRTALRATEQDCSMCGYFLRGLQKKRGA